MSITKNSIEWETIHKTMSVEGLCRAFLSKREYELAKDKYTATLNDDYLSLSLMIRDRVIERWIYTQQQHHKQNVKRVYYLSLEFLIGRLLGSNMQNLGMTDAVHEMATALGLDIERIREAEADAGLGNGGLGRLAACFLDSLATLGIPAMGYGIRYDYGIFHQKICNGYQVESPDAWLVKGNPWELERYEYAVRIKFYGRVNMFTDKKGKLRVQWVDTEDVLAIPYDMPIVGYRNDVVNNLRLWSARSTEEFDLSDFNSGDYEGAVYHKVLSENITKVLYPNDNKQKGKELRLKQEYFFTAAAISDILRRFKAENSDFFILPEKVQIQLNDTHPSLAIVELMRLLVDEENYEWEAAWSICIRTFAYTNHTLMPEALETWPVPLLEKLLPRHMQMIYEINSRFLEFVFVSFPGDVDRRRRMSLIAEGPVKKVRMAFLSIIASHSVNGVSALHSELIKTDLFRDFYELYPERFNNKTNGITQRRWLQIANYGLSDLITESLGSDSWKKDFAQINGLLNFKNDPAFHQKWQKVKATNKNYLAQHIEATTGIVVNPHSIFDVQIKRIHEYKRQLLFALYMIAHYLKIKRNPHNDIVPRTFIVGGKAAPGYYIAKLIIKFITSIAEVVNKDKQIGDAMKVVFLENYRVSLAEKIFPASDLSEQISTAGTEASGTGNMKFMMNGALTIGTVDGANIEIAEAVGNDNIFSFGLRVEQVNELMQKGYAPRDYLKGSSVLKEVITLIESNFFSPNDYNLFKPLLERILLLDQYFVCADFDSYALTQAKVTEEYLKQDVWTEKSIINVAQSVRFSSDRTISDYAKDIWDIPVI
jgi:glycogen phosphorylase